MMSTNLQRVRRLTTSNTTLLPDSVISDLLYDNTDPVTEVVNLNLAIADAFDYMASQTEGGDVKSWTRGPTSVTFGETYRAMALRYRALAGVSSIGAGVAITVGTRTRADFPDGSNDPEFHLDP
jgi:hypothetical protein